MVDGDVVSGMRSSASEHLIPERLFSTEDELAEGASDAFKKLVGLTGLFGLVGSFFDILFVSGCNELDASAGALLSFIAGIYLTKLSLILIAGLLNPILLVFAIVVITQIIGYVQSLVTRSIKASCQA